MKFGQFGKIEKIGKNVLIGPNSVIRSNNHNFKIFQKPINQQGMSEGKITIEDDGEGYPGEILSKIGEPYLRSLKNKDKNRSGLGLGIFIGKNLLEKNFASLNCQNSKTRTGAEVNIKWKNQDLKKI